ncbi:MAG TPA: NAD(P)H-binding protein [Burkholderiaceae bacterium]|nr:NAD(P)H-binding protein [Burkholderiaceae bacterium]
MKRAPRKLGRPTLLIVGCGDVGGRILARARDRFRVLAVTRQPAQVAALRAAGAVPLLVDLDDAAQVRRLAPFAARVVHLAPPPERGTRDPRTRRLLAAFGARAGRLAYVSTTGVYGDRRGAPTDETTPTRPGTERARRRVDAEATLRRHGRAGELGSSVLRAPGIYAHDRLPTQRLRAGLPALTPEDDVYTNHIHAEDLARLCLAALARGRPQRVYNAVDDSDLRMGDYLDAVAQATGLPAPPRLPRAQLAQAVSAVMLSFMSESRRIGNARLKRELRTPLAWPTVADTLESLAPVSAGTAPLRHQGAALEPGPSLRPPAQ